MENDPPRPELPQEVEKLLQDSGMELALCGGMTVGLKPPPPKVWRICPIDSKAQIERRTAELRRMTSAIRLIQRMLNLIRDGEGETSRIINDAKRFLNQKD